MHGKEDNSQSKQSHSMTFPESDRVIFDQNPLEQVICQLRFPTILEISTEKPAKFQNKIREAYPLFESEQAEFPQEIAEVLSRLPISKPDVVTYKFISPDNAKLISLTPEFIAFTDKNYIRWERFEEEITRAQKALEEIYKPAFYTRVGLRYRDVIDRKKLGIHREPWEELLKPSLIGLLGAQDNVGKHVRKIKTEATVELEEIAGGLATIRQGLAQASPNGRDIYVIDVDFHTTERSYSKDVPEILRKFNVLGGNLFRWAITDKLRGALGPRKLQPGD